ncbi:MAG: FAD-dependent oxidoreductase [Bacteroidetes bacterium]|nr:FAD-dependent oxidoreductase [Bacteroidota bacterium]
MIEGNKKVVIIGAGIAGLSAGTYLKKTGKYDILFIEASNKPGGRIKTENIDNFILDNGLHLFFTANPYLLELLDIDKLNLKYFESGAIIMKNHSYRKIYDPLQHPKHLLKSIFSSICTLGDKIKIIKRRAELKSISFDKVFEKYEVKTSSILKKRKFSSLIIKNIFQPVFSQLFMENELTTSRRMFEFYLKLMADGKMAIPAKGTEEIPKQLASNFEKENFIFNTKAVEINENIVTLDNGEKIQADAFLIATEQNGFYSKIKNTEINNNQRGVTCFYFSANKRPYKEKLICFNANNPKLVSSMIVLTNISHHFAPHNKVLIAVNINGVSTIDENDLETEIKDEISKVFGSQVYDWQKIKSYKINNAIPNQDFVLGKRQASEIKISDNIYVCGDHLINSSLYGAMRSAKVAIEMLHNDFFPSKKSSSKKNK